MKMALAVSAFLLLLNGPTSFAATAPKKEKLKVIRTIPHSGYSEGLEFHNGFLWHSLPKEVVKINPKDGAIVNRFPPASAYNESLTWFKDALYIVSYSDNGIYKGTLSGETLSFERVGSTPEVHAWGIVSDGKDIYMTGNYSRQIYKMDPKDFSIKNTIVVADVTDIEDLAWDGSALWASSFTEHRGTIFRIDPTTGKTSHYSELPTPDDCPVIDGLAVQGDTFWITGKNCTVIYNVKIPRVERALGSKK